MCLRNNLTVNSSIANNTFNNNLVHCNNLTLNNNVTPILTTLPFVPCFKPLFASNSTLHVNQLDHGSLDSRQKKGSRTRKGVEKNITGTRENTADNVVTSSNDEASAPSLTSRCSLLLPKHVSFSMLMKQQQAKIHVITVPPPRFGDRK